MGHKILIVDDELGIRESLKEYFEMQDFSVAVADCGEQALSLLNVDSFDLILSDVRMPRGDGRFLLSKVKAKDSANPVFLMMSGFTDMTVEQACSEGAAALFTKPFNPGEILKTVKRYLLKPEDRWKKIEEVKKKITILLDAKNLAQACENNLVSCGQFGLYVPAQDLPKIGEQIEIKFLNSSSVVNGIVKWTRDRKSSKPKGYGIEFSQMSDDILAEFKKYVSKVKPIAAIPAD
jgi:DNA-binding response OmpR family regulator